MHSKDFRITSAKHAQKESMKLKTIWSNETRLTQRILIYVAELLEQIAHKPHRAKTPWR
jgi:hypothetical protein